MGLERCRQSGCGVFAAESGDKDALVGVRRWVWCFLNT
jgi:hypothetical protein